MASDFTKTADSDIAMDVAMGVTDPAAIATDVALDELIDSLVSHYANAASGVENKTNEYFKKFKDEDEKKLAEVKSGKLKKNDYTKWRAQKMLTGDNYKKLQEVLTSDMTNSNQIAADIINHKKSDIYALNHNYGVYEIEHSTGLATSYVLYDHNTVEHLIADNPKLLPKNKINIPADKKWNAQKINNAITQGVLQGEPIPDIAKRLRGVTDMNKNAAIRNARTATTGAQNAGREQSYERAEKMGIDMLQVWVSTIDGRTRHSHRILMGEKAKVGKKFSNGLYFPGDPDGPGREVYNCRCTVIAEVNGFDHGIKEMVDAKLKEKGMTWDEWVDEQPLPKKTGETKAQYLARYSQLKKKQSFDEWLGMQAAPDEAIVDLWANKGWSKVFYEIYDKDHAAANAFKKELTDLGNQRGLKPKDVWDQYLRGELDSEDFNKFENILRKHLGEPEIKPDFTPTLKPVAAPPVVTPDVIEDMSDKAKEAASKITHQKGEPMDMAKADNHNTNPLYDKGYSDSGINCQTCALTYEARRQGYDVIALPRNLNKNIEKLQHELALNTRKAWIKKDTGGMVQPIFKDKSGTGKSLHDLLDKKVGTNGERYCIDFNWKSGGGHVINLDRDENGVLRLIDNQRGIGEKQIWVGEKEIVQYLDRVKGLQLYRVDDCIPNPKFFNKICVKSSDVKSTRTFEKLGLNNAEKISNLLDLDMDDAKEYYNAWRVGLKKNKKLDDFLKNEKSIPSVDIATKSIDAAADFKKSLPEDWVKLSFRKDYGKIITSINKELKYSDYKTISEYWDAYRKGEILNMDLDDIFSGAKNIAAEVESLFGKDSMSKVYNELKALHGTSTANEFYNKILKPMGKQSDVWKKYVANELSEIDAKKIDDFLLKHIGAKAPKPVTKVDDIADIAKNKYGATDLDDLVNKLMDDDDVNNLLYKYATNNNNLDAPTTLLKKYLNGDVDIPDLDDHIKAAKTVSTPKPASIATNIKDIKKVLPDSFSDFYDMYGEKNIDLYDKVDSYIAKHHGTDKFSDYWKKYLNGDIDAPELDDILKDLKVKSKPTPVSAPTPNLDIDTLKKKSVTNVYNELKNDLSSKDANAFYKELKDIGAKDGLKQGDVWKKYLNGELDADDVVKIEKHLGKYKTTDKVDDDVVDVIKTKYDKYDVENVDDAAKVLAFFDPDTVDILLKFDQGPGGITYSPAELAKKYVKGEINIPELDKYLGIKKSTLTPTPSTPIVDLNALKNKKMSQVYNDIKATDTKTANQFYNELKKMGKPSEVWDQYLKGELTDEQKEIIEKHLIKKYSTSSGKNISTTPLSTAEATKLEKEIKSAEKELEKFSNKTYKIDVSAGAEDVSASDYKIYKDDLKKKKESYNETIDALMNLKPGDPDYWKIQMLSEEQKLQQIEKYKKILKNIDDFEKDGKKYLELQEKISKNKDKLNAASAGEQAKKLEEAKKELNAAEKALKDNIDVDTKWHGIWKEDVTVEDYPIKKSTIAAKKQWYNDKIEELEHAIDDPDSWHYKSLGGPDGINNKIQELETYLEDLDEFEELGKKYEKYKKAVDKAKDKVNAATPVGEAYTETRKNNAKWFHSKDYYKGDTYYDTWSRPIHNNATTMEKRAYKDYTSASGGFNRPLAGFQAPQYSGAGGWNPSNFKGVGKVNIDNEGKGKKIKDLTKFVEKSKTPDDIWIQTAQNFATLEGPGGKGFLPGVNYGDLAKMSDTDLQQFVGVESKFGQFISGSINRGGGSYTPGDVRINIYCPQGSEALYVLEDGSFGKSEHEIILQRGGTYRVSKIYWGTDAEKGGRKLIVDLELRLEKGYDKYI